jgi:hypothetical protein
MSGNNGDAGGWLLMDTFCIHEACTCLAGDGWVHRANILDVFAVEDNPTFLYWIIKQLELSFMFILRAGQLRRYMRRLEMQLILAVCLYPPS